LYSRGAHVGVTHRDMYRQNAARVATGRVSMLPRQWTAEGSVLLPAGVFSTEWITWLRSKYTMKLA